MDTENEWSRNKYYSTSQAYDDEEEEEEIDVVSVHNNGTSSHNSASHLNMNYHNYFHAPGGIGNGGASGVLTTPSSTSKKQPGSKKNSKNNEGSLFLSTDFWLVNNLIVFAFVSDFTYCTTSFFNMLDSSLKIIVFLSIDFPPTFWTKFQLHLESAPYNCLETQNLFINCRKKKRTS